MSVSTRSPRIGEQPVSLRLTGLLLTGLLLACAPRSLGRYDRDQLAERLASTPATDGPAAAPPGVVIGEYTLASPSVIDGDTIKVVGIEGTLRLLGIDTEETFKSDQDRRAYDEGFETYLAKKQEGHDRPIKAATPLGMEAKHWAQEFFEGVRSVRLERDHPKELRGRYGRLLTYVMVERDGRWLNYNVECVRAGMSPYFTKYGYSRRFHDQFVQAQAEARAAGRGIWDPTKEHYPDYELRLRWWDARADVIQRFEREAEGRDNWISLTNWDALDRLEALEGQEVVLLATVGEIRPREGKGPARVMLSRRMFSDLPLIFFDDGILAESDAEEARGEFVRVHGTVSRYVFRTKRGRGRTDDPPPSQLQIQIRKPTQIAFVDTRPARFSAALVDEALVGAPASSSEPEPETDASDDVLAPTREAPADAADTTGPAEITDPAVERAGASDPPPEPLVEALEADAP
ncbi:MAG: thermonuclease family protein [Myxococcales bacterium]|nr:thermonuclease family protein [Myxococcales bacterium]